MNDKQRADLEAGQRGKQFNVDNATPLGVIILLEDTLAPIIAGISAQVSAVELAESKQQHDSGEVADEKETLKLKMAETVVKYALRAEIKAKSLGLDDLETSLQHPVTYIFQADDVLSVTRAKDMRDIMDANKGPAGVLTNITAAFVTEMTDAIKAFSDIANKPTEVIKEKKAQGTDKIQPEVDLLNDFIDSERKILHSYWDGTVNSDLADEFDLKTHPVVLGTRHNTVSVTQVRDEDGKALIGGLVTCEANGKTSNGFKTNVYEIVGIRTGKKSFKAEATGRITENFEVTVKSRTKVEVTVRMKLV